MTEVDRENWLCRVRVGELETNWINWLTLRAGGARTWWCPSPDEQVVVLSMGGNLETAFVLPAIYSNQFAPPSDSVDGCVTEYPDGGWFEYEPATGRWHVRGIKSMVIEAADNITLKIDPAVVLATRKYVDDKVLELKVYVDELMAKHLAAADPHTQYVPKESPTLTGTPKAPTALAGNNSMQIANTAFVQAVVTALNNALALKAPLASPALTGTPTAPTAAQTANNTQVATTAFVKSAVAGLVGSSPEALDTLNELAEALGNDPNFATTVMNALPGKQPPDATLTNLSGKSISGLLEYLGLTEALGNKQNYSQQLTALSGLEIAKDKLPFFNSNNSADITTLTNTGCDIIAKNTVDEVRTLLQLGSAALKIIGTGANQVPDMNAFGVSKNEIGYQYLPGGLILQWGKVGPTQAGQTQM